VESPEQSVPTILIADDDALIRLVLERALRARGYAVTATSTRHDCFAEFSNSRFDLAILDAHMPGPSLEESLALMSETRPLPRTIIMSGDLERPSWLRAEFSYISKPFDLSTFLETVAAYLDGGEPTTHSGGAPR
jgi:two-component system nitrogen regulation response regulator GlnG